MAACAALLAAEAEAGRDVGPGRDVRVWAGSPLERVWPDSQPRTESGEGGVAAWTIRADGARAEVVTAQLALRSQRGLKVLARASDLAGPGGARIDAGAVRLQWERRIALTRSSPATPPEELDRAAPCEVADPFWEGAEGELTPDRTEAV